MIKIYRSNQRPMPADLNVWFACSLRISQRKNFRGIMHIIVWHLLSQNVSNPYAPKHTFSPGKLRIFS